nr:MAG TPA: hypothetical protein [Caudoviricetes sp.]
MYPQAGRTETEKEADWLMVLEKRMDQEDIASAEKTKGG